MELLVLRLEKQTVGLELNPLYVGNIPEVDGSRSRAGLERVKMWLGRDRADCDKGEKFRTRKWAHLVLVYRQRLLFEYQPLWPP